MSRNVKLYYLSSVFEGLRFLVPVWLIWYTKFVSMSTVGLIESLGIIVGMLLEVPTGAFADVVGRKTAIVIGKVGIALGAFVVSLATGSTSLIVGVFIWNVFGAFINGANSALIYDHLKSIGQENSYAKVTANANTISRIGIIVGSFAGGYLFSIWEPLPYFLFGVTTLVEAIIWLFVSEPLLDSVKYNANIYYQTMVAGFKAISHSSYLRLISVVSVVIAAYAYLFREYLNYSYAIDLKLDAEAQSWLFGVSGILKTVAVLLAGYLISCHVRSKIIFYYLFSFTLVLLTSNWAGFWGGIVVISLVEFISATAPVISTTYMNQELESSVRATAMSFINMFTSLTYAVGLFMGMYFIDRFKSPIVYTVFGGLLLIISLWLYRNYSRLTIGAR